MSIWKTEKINFLMVNMPIIMIGLLGTRYCAGHYIFLSVTIVVFPPSILFMYFLHFINRETETAKV